MRPLKLSTIRMLTVAGIGEATVYGMFGTSVATGLMAANVTWMAAVPAAIVAWNVGQLAVGQGLTAGSNALGYGLGKGLVKINDGANSVIGSGLRAVRMLVGGPSNKPGAAPETGGPLITGANPEMLKDAMNRAATGPRPVMLDVMFTESGYKAFMESAKATKIPVVDLDSLDEAKAGRARRAYTDVAQPIAEITKLTDKAPLTTEDVARIVERTAVSDIAPEHKEALYKTLNAELAEERASLEAAKATRLTNAEKADQAGLELDNASLTRLRDNAAFVEQFQGLELLSEPDRFFQALQRSVAQEGVEATLAKLAQDPTQFAVEIAVSPPGTTEARGWLGRGRAPEPSTPVREGQQIALEPEVMRGLNTYVENVGAVKDNAAAVIALRTRQMELEAALAERAAALETVENQIRRETALLDPQTQRQILRDSLQTILDSKKTAEPELVRAGMTTAHAEEREADVAAGHQIQDAATAVAHGESVAGVTALTQSEIVIRGFESLSTQAIGRFYEAHPEKDPIAPQHNASERSKTDEDLSKLGDVMIVEGFPPPEDAAPGRSIRTRTRRPKAQQGGMEM